MSGRQLERIQAANAERESGNFNRLLLRTWKEQIAEVISLHRRTCKKLKKDPSFKFLASMEGYLIMNLLASKCSDGRGVSANALANAYFEEVEPVQSDIRNTGYQSAAYRVVIAALDLKLVEYVDQTSDNNMPVRPTKRLEEIFETLGKHFIDTIKETTQTSVEPARTLEVTQDTRELREPAPAEEGDGNVDPER
jgi:hypothetical protein